MQSVCTNRSPAATICGRDALDVCQALSALGLSLLFRLFLLCPMNVFVTKRHGTISISQWKVVHAHDTCASRDTDPDVDTSAFVTQFFGFLCAWHRY